MFNIVLTNGKVINIKGDHVEWQEKSRTTRIINDRITVAQINMDNVIGWINNRYLIESEMEK
jgi:hypothetical protein